MADETSTNSLASLAAAEASIDAKTQTVSPITDKVVDENLVVDHTTAQQNRPEIDGSTKAADRLRAFEDAELGENAVRINGRVERGYGSRFRELPEAKQRQHAALEKLVEAELVLADFDSKRERAQADYDAAQAAVDAAKAEADNGGA